MLKFIQKVTAQKYYLAAVSLLIVFVLDIFTPERLGVDILYLCAILLVSEQDARTIIAFTVMVCILIMIDENIFAIRSTAKVTKVEWANRCISIFAILMTSLIIIRYQKYKAIRLMKEKQYLSDLKAMMFMTSHEVRKPLANIIGLINILETDKTEYEKCVADLRSSANELDNFVHQLNNFIERTESVNKLVDDDA